MGWLNIMALKIKELLHEFSFLEIVVIMVIAMIFFDMFFYHIMELLGREAHPYPIIREIISIIKEFDRATTGL